MGKKRPLPSVIEFRPLSLAAIVTAWLSNIHNAHANGGPPNIDVAQRYNLRTTICANKCESDCVIFDTPIDECFSARQLLPDDPESWSEFDILDSADVSKTDDAATVFQRTIFASVDGTCDGNATDIFTIPLEECVGPFGPPRPWGNFSIVVKNSVYNKTHDRQPAAYAQPRIRRQ